MKVITEKVDNRSRRGQILKTVDDYKLKGTNVEKEIDRCLVMSNGNDE